MVPAVALAVMAGLACLVPVGHRWLGRNLGWLLAVGFLGVGGLLCTAAPAIADGETVEFSRPWFASIGVSFSLRLDGLALLFALVVLGVGALVMAYCTRYLGHGSHVPLYTLMTVFALSMLVLVLADDIVLLFIGWELTTLCSFFLIGGVRPSPAPAALRTLLVTAGGGAALLAGLIVLAVHTGTTRLSAILADDSWTADAGVTAAVIVLLILGAATKSAQLPFHFWLPDAMVAITPVSAYLHAAAMVKAGVYLLMRFAPPLADSQLWTVTLICVGMSTALVGALFALQQHDLKQLLAYSTVSQLGFVVALIGIGTPVALAAAALHVLAHALFKATLFMLVGTIDRQLGSRDIRELTGLWRVMPVTAALTGLAGLSLAGVPPLLGFASKEEMFAAFHGLPGPGWAVWVVSAAAIAAAAFTFAYGLRIFSGALRGPTVQRRLHEPGPAFLTPAAIAAVAGLALGLGVSRLGPLIERVVADTRHHTFELDLRLWHGLSPELAMSGAAFAAGTTLFVFNAPIDRALQRLRLPTSGRRASDRVRDAVVAAGEWTASLTGRTAPAAHLPVPVLALIGVAAAAVATGFPLETPPAATTRATDWIVVVLLAAAVSTAVLQRSRLGAVVAIGFTGFVVGLWFLLAGAPDLALTQVLFEIITAVVAVLVLRGLPRRFHTVGRRRVVLSAAIAAAAGLSAAVATFTLTGRRERSPVAEHLLLDAEPETGSTNVVNAILVEFRALDTLGETAVLVAAGLGLVALRDSNPPTPAWKPADADDSTLIIDVVRRAVTPVLVLISVWLLLRGHHAPGGGFIAGLVGGAGLCLAHLSRPTPSRPPPRPLLAAGLALAVGTGLAALAASEPFLQPAHTTVHPLGLSIPLSTSMLFDLGVYSVVIGTVMAALNRLARYDTTQ